MSQLSDRVMLQALQEIFFHLSERNICRVVLLPYKGLQMLANSIVTIQRRCLYFDAYLLCHIFNHSVVSFQKGDLSLHTSLELLFDISCRKDFSSLAKDSIS